VTRPTIRLYGSRTAQSAFASINRHWMAALRQRDDILLLDDEDAATADVVVHHDFSVRFGDLIPPGRRKVAVRPWDFGPFPRRWVDVIQHDYDELWIHSNWSRQSALAGGVPESAVRVIPLGVDPAIMGPDGPCAKLDIADDTFVFAFVGATVRRKGGDIILDAFRRAFGPRDPVALVVKDHTGDVFYQQQSCRERFLSAAADSSGPRVVYLDDYVPSPDLAALYRRADAFVLPYRAEGFACTILEAMACGAAPIVPAFGPCLDYCDRDTSILVPTRAITLPVGRTLGMNSLGFEEHVDTIQFCETSVDKLAAVLRDVTTRPRAEIHALGRRASARASHWTWARSAEAIAGAVRTLSW
jgi:glycosyltransferase involved in cell wall biosynthesis